MKINKQGEINAPIELIFEVLTDIEVFRDEIAQANKGENYKLNYDRKKPFGIGNRIVLSMDSPALILTITQYEAPNLLSMNMEPNKNYVGFLGVGNYSASLEK